MHKQIIVLLIILWTTSCPASDYEADDRRTVNVLCLGHGNPDLMAYTLTALDHYMPVQEHFEVIAGAGTGALLALYISQRTEDSPTYTMPEVLDLFTFSIDHRGTLSSLSSADEEDLESHLLRMSNTSRFNQVHILVAGEKCEKLEDAQTFSQQNLKIATGQTTHLPWLTYSHLTDNAKQPTDFRILSLCTPFTLEQGVINKVSQMPVVNFIASSVVPSWIQKSLNFGEKVLSHVSQELLDHLQRIYEQLEQQMLTHLAKRNGEILQLTKYERLDFVSELSRPNNNLEYMLTRLKTITQWQDKLKLWDERCQDGLHQICERMDIALTCIDIQEFQTGLPKLLCLSSRHAKEHATEFHKLLFEWCKAANNPLDALSWVTSNLYRIYGHLQKVPSVEKIQRVWSKDDCCVLADQLEKAQSALQERYLESNPLWSIATVTAFSGISFDDEEIFPVLFYRFCHLPSERKEFFLQQQLLPNLLHPAPQAYLRALKTWIETMETIVTQHNATKSWASKTIDVVKNVSANLYVATPGNHQLFLNALIDIKRQCP